MNFIFKLVSSGNFEMCIFVNLWYDENCVTVVLLSINFYINSLVKHGVGLMTKCIMHTVITYNNISITDSYNDLLYN